VKVFLNLVRLAFERKRQVDQDRRVDQGVTEETTTGVFGCTSRRGRGPWPSRRSNVNDSVTKSKFRQQVRHPHSLIDGITAAPTR